jgi:hypothetical protein
MKPGRDLFLQYPSFLFFLWNTVPSDINCPVHHNIEIFVSQLIPYVPESRNSSNDLMISM